MNIGCIKLVAQFQLHVATDITTTRPIILHGYICVSLPVMCKDLPVMHEGLSAHTTTAIMIHAQME